VQRWPQLSDQLFNIGKDGVQAGGGHGLGGQLACRDRGVEIGGKPGAAVVLCRQVHDAAAGQIVIYRWRAAGAVQHHPRRQQLLNVAGMAAVQPHPAARIAGELGGQPGRLLGSSVGDHRDRRVGHGNHPLTARNGCSSLGSARDVLGIKDNRRAERSAHLADDDRPAGTMARRWCAVSAVVDRTAERFISADRSEPLEVVADPIDDRDPIEANSLLPRHVAIAVP
jgi:hypothetical protein